MANGKKDNARRREVRRTLPQSESTLIAFLRRREVGWAAAFVVGLAVPAALVMMLLGGDDRLRVGQRVDEAIVSRADFRTEDAQATAAAKEAARKEVLRIYRFDPRVFEALRSQVNSLARLTEKERLEDISETTRNEYQLDQAAFEALKRVVGPMASAGASVGVPATQPGGGATGGSGLSDAAIRAWEERTDRFVGTLFADMPVFAPEAVETLSNEVEVHLLLPRPEPDTGDRTKEWPVNWLLTSQDEVAIERALEDIIALNYDAAELRPVIRATVLQRLKPMFTFDPDLTLETRNAAVAAVQPMAEEVPVGSVLVQAGAVITAEDLALLEQERHAYDERLDGWSVTATLLSQMGLMLLLAVAVWVYIFAYNGRIVRNPMRGFALTALFLVCQFAAAIGALLWPNAMYGGAFPTLIATMILAIAYDQRFALAMGAAHVVLVTLTLAAPVAFALVALAGVAVTAAQLPGVKTRSTMVRVGLSAGVAMGFATLMTALISRPLEVEGVWRTIAIDALWALAGGTFAGMFVQAILPFIERAFKVTTHMTLRELNDASHPLLQRLAQDAPGTYQHSLRIADMAEAAADAIGADGLLCRVGAMYHDIGKMNKPGYFIENQGGGPNRHDKLSPAMSLLIIVGHVKDGSEMAREAGLPANVRHFIESHHGTTLVEFFYHAARKQKEKEGQAQPSEFEFRYPGPKPKTREAAILLLCDGVESAARSLPEPTPVRLEGLVSMMANKRLMDGQFDECNLTLRELALIEAAMVKTLCAVYHTRIKYPGDKPAEKPEAKPAEKPAEKSEPKPAATREPQLARSA